MLPTLVLALSLTFEQIFAAAPPWGAQPERLMWSPGGTSFLYVLPSQDTAQPQPVLQYDRRTGQSRVLIDPARYGPHAGTPSLVSWSPDGLHVAFSERGTLYVRDMTTGLDRTVAQDAGDALWSPRGDAVAYTHKANLFVAYLESKLRTLQLTQDGAPDAVLNGELDWVYPEELGTAHGFAWSPSGRFVAYLHMDERAVTNFPIVSFAAADGAVRYQRYPLAGELNPRVVLHAIDVQTLHDRVLYDAGARDEYLPAFAWTPVSDTLNAEVLDRAQQHLRVIAWANPAAALRTIYEEQSRSWTDVIPLPVRLRDGSSLWILDRDDSKGLYLLEGGNFRRLGGTATVFQLHGVDERAGIAYVSAAYPTRRDRSLLAVPLSGAPLRNLTVQPGQHAVSLSPAFDAFVDTRSTLNDPPQTEVVAMNGGPVTVIAARSDALRDELLPVRMLQVDSRYGPLDAYMIQPPGFDPQKKYPVIVYAYGGPEAPTTADSFGGMRGLYHQMLAQAGFIVFSIDGPASQVGSSRHVRLLYHNFGPGSLLGQEIGAQYLRSLPYVDGARIGIWGWSFGGYETLYALTHASSFKAGAAGSPVTDWHFYDSIYTERYMGLPQAQPSAYDASSDTLAAGALHGDLLVNHGTADDNVHMANSIAFLRAAAAAGKTNVDFYAYEGQLHHFSSLADWRHIYEHMLQWWERHL